MGQKCVSAWTRAFPHSIPALLLYTVHTPINSQHFNICFPLPSRSAVALCPIKFSMFPQEDDGLFNENVGEKYKEYKESKYITDRNIIVQLSFPSIISVYCDKCFLLLFLLLVIISVFKI